jgi:hypothetical protein
VAQRMRRLPFQLGPLKHPQTISRQASNILPGDGQSFPLL